MSITRLLFASCAALAFISPVQAQSMQGMDHSNMPGMTKPPKPAPKPTKPAAKPAKPAAKAPSAPRSTRKPAAVSKIKQQNKAPSTPAAAKPADTQPLEAESMQGMDHSAMPGMGGTQDTEAPQTSCTPEHAQMGHCTLEQESMAPTGPQSTDANGPEVMPGMTIDAGSTTEEAVDPDCPPEHAKMGHCTPKVPVGMAMGATPATGTDLAPGNAPAPAPPSDWYADRIFEPSEMATSRNDMMKESGGTTVSFISIDLAEYVVHKNKDSYRWEGEAWFGGDINRFVFKYEGEGEFGGSVDDAEFQALYSRAVSPYWNLQTGIRYDVKPDPSRTYAVVGIEGLAPYWFEVTAAAYLSNKGELRGRVEGYYDQRITQRLILQPRIEANLSAQTITELGVGAGLSNVELGARLRYEIKKEIAPYIGFEWVRQFGESARFIRAEGGQVSDPHFVVGLRLWF